MNSIVLATLNDNEDARDDTLEADRAEKILDYLCRFEYASRKHVIVRVSEM